jgi:ABC-type branched-subunit amino acid transport system substrate-binding protein
MTIANVAQQLRVPFHAFSMRRLLASCLLYLSACTLLSAPDVEQCNVTADCTALGGEFVGRTCKQHVCVASGASCTLASQCDQTSAPSVCHDGACVKITSEDCPMVVPSTLKVDDDTVVLGFMGPLKGDEATIGVPIEQGAQLALEEVQERANGIPIVAGGARKKLVMVACHDLADPMRVAEHLIVDVGVPAIIGPAFSGITLEVANGVAIPNGTLLMSASATTPSLTDLQDNGLVWRTAPSDAFQAKPLSELVARGEVKVRDEQMLAASDSIRVAVLYKGEAYGSGLFDALTEVMRFNGKSASDNGDANFLGLSYPDPSKGTVDYSEYVSKVVKFAPHIVVLLGTAEVVTKLMTPIEKAWPTVASAPEKPLYLFPDGGHDTTLLQATMGNDGLRKRVKGTVPGRKDQNYDAFALRYKGRFDNTVPGTYAENAYDAGYLLAYAMLATGKFPPTGKDIASGLTKMSEGTSVIGGPSDLNSAITALSSGSGIDYQGASGSLNFDNKTGEAKSDVEIWCVVVDQSHTRFESSGEYYDAQMDKTVGTNDNCDF